MYATRFDNPFQDVPLSEASAELMGAIFLDNNFNGANFYKDDIFPGQSDVPRWREFYFRTYDWSFIPLIMVGWGLALWSGFKLLKRTLPAKNDDSIKNPKTRTRSIVFVLGLWSMLAAVPLLGFYLYAPVISSRYMMDLAPAIGVAVVAAWYWVAGRCEGRTSRVIVCVIVCGWIGTELFLSKAVYGGPRSLSWSEVEEVRGRQSEKGPVFMLNAGVTLGDPASGIPFDRGGWNQENGAIKPTVILFVNDAEFLELELESGEHALIKPTPEDLRAKVGRERLKRESITETERGWIVRFKGPNELRWNTGLQSAFLATVANQFLAERSTPWVLKSVRWR